MMARFCAYVDKMFGLSRFLRTLRDSRKKPLIPVSNVFTSVFAMFATGRGSLNSMEKDLAHIPGRLRGVVGDWAPSVDSVGRIYAMMDPNPMRQMLCGMAHRLKRNKALADGSHWKIVAVDGHEFFSQSGSAVAQTAKRGPSRSMGRTSRYTVTAA